MQIRRLLYVVTMVVLTLAAVELRAGSPPAPSKLPAIKVVPTFSPSPITGHLTIEEVDIELTIGKPVPSVNIRYTDKVGARISLEGHVDGGTSFECSGVVSSTRKINCGPFVLAGSDLTPTTINLNLD